MQNFEVVFFKKENGSCPVEKFLNSLDVKMRAKLLRTISLLEKNGSQLKGTLLKIFRRWNFRDTH